MKNKYAEDIHIDETSLDVEWLRQPELMLEYSHIQAQAKKTLAELKEEVSLVKADLAQAIREDPESYGLDKITEKALELVILAEDDYKEVIKRQIEAQYELDMAYGAVASIDQRRSTLENLVKLMGQQYFAGPKAPRDLNFERDARRERQSRVDSSVKVKRSRRRK